MARTLPNRASGLPAVKCAIRAHPTSDDRPDRPPIPVRLVPEGIRHPMPELPEVETTRRRIAPLLVGRRIEQVHTTPPSYFFLTPPDDLRRWLVGRRIESLERLGKYLVARLDGGGRLLLHLGMTGQLFSSEATSVRLLSATARASLPPEAQIRFEPDEHTHLQLVLDGLGPRVFFRDVRK